METLIALAIANPEITLAVAQAGLAVFQTGFNFFAGGENLDKEKADIKRQQALATQGHNQQVAQIGQQFEQGGKDIVQATGADQASMAARGIVGAGADLAVQSNTTDRTGKLNQWNKNATKSEGLRWAGVQDQFQAGFDGIQSQRDQMGLDALLGLAGVGLSAAGALIKNPIQDVASPNVDTGNFLTDFSVGDRQVADYGNADPWAGFHQNGKPTKYRSPYL